MDRDIFITFDMDWASDEVLADFYELLCNVDICSTICVTHETKLLSVFRSDNRIELAVHPNYNMLLEGKKKRNELYSYTKVIDSIKQVVPEAVTVRAHSLVASSRISEQYARYGFQYDLNMFYCPQKGDCIHCFKDPMGMVRIPFLFEDDLYMMSSKKENVIYYLGHEFEAPRVFNFHPIHIFLNSENMDRYEKARGYFQNYEKLKQYCNSDYKGTKDIFVELIHAAKMEGYTFKKIKDGNWE